MFIVVRDGESSDAASRDAVFEEAGLVGGGDDVELVVEDWDADYRVVAALTGALHVSYAEHLAEHVPPPQAYLGKIAVTSTYQRGGAAKMLLAVFARRAQEAGSTHLVANLAGWADNGFREEFFARCGCYVLDTSGTSPLGAVAGRLVDVLRACDDSLNLSKWPRTGSAD